MGILLYNTEEESKRYLAQYTVNLTAGQKIEIKIGDDEMEITCPRGKVISGAVAFSIDEIDV